MKKRRTYNDIMGSLHNAHLYSNVHNYRKKYFDTLHKEVEARHERSKNLLFRKALREHQVMTNFRNELDRIHGELSKNSSRFPIATLDSLRNRVKQYHELGKQIKVEDAINNVEKKIKEEYEKAYPKTTIFDRPKN